MTFTPPQTQSFRNLAQALSPTALKGPNGQKLMYDLAICYDGLADAGGYAVQFRFPTYAPEDALPWLSKDRQITRGPDEPTASFIARLLLWLDLWRNAGSAPSVLRALASYFIGFTIVEGSTPMTIETVNDTVGGGNAWNFGPLDPPNNLFADPPNWNWDGNDYPGRAWVIIYNGPWAQTIEWGGFSWGDGTCWGSTATSSDGGSIRALIAQWKTAGCFVPEVIVAFDGTWFIPGLPPGDPKLPDGNWGGWGKVSVIGGVRTWVPSRTSTAIYLGSVT